MHFRENQYLRTPALAVILLLSFLFTVLVLWASKAEALHILMIGVFLALLGVLMYSFKLTVSLSEAGIALAFKPLFKTRHIAFADIKSIKTIAIHPVGDYGGWGYRYNPFTKTIGYIMEGKEGIELQLHSGKVIAFGVKDLPAFVERFNALNTGHQLN